MVCRWKSLKEHFSLFS